jgi:acyl carrier protein
LTRQHPPYVPKEEVLMESLRTKAEQTLKVFLQRANKPVEVGEDTLLFADGLGLDSLETAELSAQLEDDLGTDPFSEGILPQTVGELLDFYVASPSVTA